jgi:hypothetical protein
VDDLTETAAHFGEKSGTGAIAGAWLAMHPSPAFSLAGATDKAERSPAPLPTCADKSCTCTNNREGCLRGNRRCNQHNAVARLRVQNAPIHLDRIRGVGIRFERGGKPLADLARVF